MAKPTPELLRLQREMRLRVKRLKDLGVPKMKIRKIIRKLDLPLGSHINLMQQT